MAAPAGGAADRWDGGGDADDLRSSHVLPVYDYPIDPSKGQCSVIGGYVHRGSVSKAWRGLYVAGDYCGRIFVLDQRGKLRWSADSGVTLSSFGQDSAWRLYATGIDDGRVYRVKLLGSRPPG